jgi:hypothetical protein
VRQFLFDDQHAGEPHYYSVLQCADIDGDVRLRRQPQDRPGYRADYPQSVLQQATEIIQ